MKSKAIAVTAMVLLALAVQSASAGNAVGYNKVVIPAHADVRLTMPFTQAAEGDFTVATKVANGVTVSNTFVANQYAPLDLSAHYYVRLLTGPGAGLWTDITANGVNSLTLADTRVLGYVAAGNSFRIYKHHTLGSLFPAGTYGVSYNDSTSILLFDNSLSAMAQNHSATQVAYYDTEDGWVGAGIDNTTVIKPETQFVVRNDSADALTVVLSGVAPDYSVSMLIAPNGDLNVGTGYPVPVALKASGLDSGSGVDGRVALLYDNTLAGLNKSANWIAYYDLDGGWDGAGITDGTMILPSQSVTLRLPANEPAVKITIAKPY